MPLCPYSASNPTKTLSAEPDHSFLMLSSLFLNVSNDGPFPTSGGNSTLQEKKKITHRRNLNEPNPFSCQHPVAALLFLLKCHTAETPSKGHGEEVQQTVKKTLIPKNNPLAYLPCNLFFQVVARQEIKACREKKPHTFREGELQLSTKHKDRSYTLETSINFLKPQYQKCPATNSKASLCARSADSTLDLKITSLSLPLFFLTFHSYSQIVKEFEVKFGSQITGSPFFSRPLQT